MVDEGWCPIPQVYPEEKEPPIIYDAEGNPLVPKRIRLGFDLWQVNEK